MFGFGQKNTAPEKEKGAVKHYFDPNAAVNLPATIKQVEEYNLVENKNLVPNLILPSKQHLYFGGLDQNGLPHGVGMFCFACEDILFLYYREKFEQSSLPPEKKSTRAEAEVLEILSCNNENFSTFGMYDRYGGCWVHGSFHGEGVLLHYANYTNQSLHLCTAPSTTADPPTAAETNASSPSSPPPLHITMTVKPLLNHDRFSFKYQGNFHLGKPQGDAYILYGKYYSEPLPLLERNPAFYSFFAGPTPQANANDLLDAVQEGKAPNVGTQLTDPEQKDSTTEGSGGIGSALLTGLSYLSPFSSSSAATQPTVPPFYSETLINVPSARKPREYHGSVGGGQFLFKHGHGLLVYQNNDTYEGEFVFNVRHGKGKLNLASKREVYEGSFERNRKNGYGVLRFLNANQYYKGSFVDDVREGEGIMRFSNGDEYLGSFKNNSIEGFGTMKYKNGDVYEGEWREGIRNGLGTYSLKRNKLGMTMKGFFVNGLVHGEGSLEIPNVSVFVGNFRRGERTAGTIFFTSDAGDPRVDFDLKSLLPNAKENPSTSEAPPSAEPPQPNEEGEQSNPMEHYGPKKRVRRCYQGGWNGDNMEGKGLLWYNDGSFYCGYFKQNRRHGPGNYRELHRYEDKDRDDYYMTEYSGFFYNDYKQGWGIQREEHVHAEGEETDSTGIDNRDIIDGLLRESTGGSSERHKVVSKIRCGLWRRNQFIEGYAGEWDGENFCGLGTMNLNLLSFFSNPTQGGGGASQKEVSLFIRAMQELSPLFYPPNAGGGLLKLLSLGTRNDNASDDAGNQKNTESCDYERNLVFIAPATAQSILSPALLDKLGEEEDERSGKPQQGRHSSSPTPAATGDTSAPNNFIISSRRREMIQFFGMFLKGQRDGPGLLALPTLGKLPGGPLFSGGEGSGIRRHLIQSYWKENLLCTGENQKGLWVFPTGEVYYGGFLNGERHDRQGVLLLMDGSIYMGPFQRNQPQGKGILLVKNVEEPLYRAASRSCRTTMAAPSEEPNTANGEEGDEKKDNDPSLPPSNNNNNNNNNAEGGILKTVGGLFNLFSFSSHSESDPKDSDSRRKRLPQHSESYIKYLKRRKLVGFRDYYLLIAQWEREAQNGKVTDNIPTRAVFNDISLKKLRKGSSKDKSAAALEATFYPVLNTASSFINAPHKTPFYHYTPNSFNFFNQLQRQQEEGNEEALRYGTLLVDPQSTLADALDLLNNSEEEEEGYDDVSKQAKSKKATEGDLYTSIRIPPAITVSKIENKSVLFFLSSNIVVVTENNISHITSIEVPHRPFSVYDLYVRDLLANNFFSYFTNAAVLVDEETSGSGSDPSKDDSRSNGQPTSFAEQSTLSPLIAKFLQWREEKLHQKENTKADHKEERVGRQTDTTTSKTFFSPLQMGEVNLFPPVAAADDGRDRSATASPANEVEALLSDIQSKAPKWCSICDKEFSFFKRSNYCALCFRNVCSNCLHALELNPTTTTSSSSSGGNSNGGSPARKRNQSQSNPDAVVALADRSNKLLNTFQKIISDMEAAVKEGNKKKGEKIHRIPFENYFPPSFYTTIDTLDGNNNGENADTTGEYYYNTVPSINPSLDPAAPANVSSSNNLLLLDSGGVSASSGLTTAVNACPDCARTVLLLNIEYETIFIPQHMFQSVFQLNHWSKEELPLPQHETKMESIRKMTQSDSLPPVSSQFDPSPPDGEEREEECTTPRKAENREVDEPLDVVEQITTPSIHEKEAEKEGTPEQPSPVPVAPSHSQQQNETTTTPRTVVKDGTDYIIYKGYLSKGLPHLFGEIWWTTFQPSRQQYYQYYYCGSFYEGKRHGFGILKFFGNRASPSLSDESPPNPTLTTLMSSSVGERYEGNFTENHFEGKHNYYYCADGSVIEGSFHRGQLTSLNYYGHMCPQRRCRSGRGIYFYHVRNLTTRPRTNVGTGTSGRHSLGGNGAGNPLDFTMSPGTVYNGEWQNGKREGSGMLLFFSKRHQKAPSEELTAGEGGPQETTPANSRSTPMGVITHELTRIFRGTLKANKLHGRGVLQEECHSVYDGEFLHNSKHGKGVEFFYHTDYIQKRLAEEASTGNKESDINELFHYCLRTTHDPSRWEQKGKLFRSIHEASFNKGLLHGRCRQYIFHENGAKGGKPTVHHPYRHYPFSIYETTFHNGSERDDCFDIRLQLDDSGSATCCNPTCKRSFSLLHRRHHCRLCGLLFCAACSSKRAVLPQHFYTSLEQTSSVDNENNNNNNNGATANSSGGNNNLELQRVCDDCFVRLEQRRQLAIKKYYFYPPCFDNGDEEEEKGKEEQQQQQPYAIYAGMWSHNTFVGRGLYYRSDGVYIVMDERGRPLVQEEMEEERRSEVNDDVAEQNPTTLEAKTAVEEDKQPSHTLLDQGPSRETLHRFTRSSSKKDLESFLLWWSLFTVRAGLPLPIDAALQPFLTRYKGISSVLFRRGSGAVGATASNNNNSSGEFSPSRDEALKKEAADFLSGKMPYYRQTSRLAQYFSDPSVLHPSTTAPKEKGFYRLCPTFPSPPSVKLFLPFKDVYGHLVKQEGTAEGEGDPIRYRGLYALFRPYVCDPLTKDPLNSPGLQDCTAYASQLAAQYTPSRIPSAPSLPSAALVREFTDSTTTTLPPDVTLPEALETLTEDVLPQTVEEVHTVLTNNEALLLRAIRCHREETFPPYQPPAPVEGATKDSAPTFVQLCCYEKDKQRLCFFPPTPNPPERFTNQTIHYDYYDYLRRTPSFAPFLGHSTPCPLEFYYYTLPLLMPTVDSTELFLEKGKIHYAARLLDSENPNNSNHHHHHPNGKNSATQPYFTSPQYFETADSVGRAWLRSREGGGGGGGGGQENFNNNHNNVTWGGGKDRWIPYPFEGPFDFTMGINDIQKGRTTSPTVRGNIPGELVTIQQKEI